MSKFVWWATNSLGSLGSNQQPYENGEFIMFNWIMFWFPRPW